uniref:Putative secreted protein n=1 Tax=Ixodes ricinus TaxID=34613 RepID=A0A147BR54_IXORI
MALRRSGMRWYRMASISRSLLSSLLCTRGSSPTLESKKSRRVSGSRQCCKSFPTYFCRSERSCLIHATVAS